VGVVWNRAQGREDHLPREVKVSIGGGGVRENKRYFATAHFDLVMMGVTLLYVPGDASVRVDHPTV
jgi:hypothetical protein